jgi:hypothetical protein
MKSDGVCCYAVVDRSGMTVSCIQLDSGRPLLCTITITSRILQESPLGLTSKNCDTLPDSLGKKRKLFFSSVALILTRCRPQPLSNHFPGAKIKSTPREKGSGKTSIPNNRFFHPMIPGENELPGEIDRPTFCRTHRSQLDHARCTLPRTGEDGEGHCCWKLIFEWHFGK